MNLSILKARTVSFYLYTLILRTYKDLKMTGCPLQVRFEGERESPGLAGLFRKGHGWSLPWHNISHSCHVFVVHQTVGLDNGLLSPVYFPRDLKPDISFCNSFPTSSTHASLWKLVTRHLTQNVLYELSMSQSETGKLGSPSIHFARGHRNVMQAGRLVWLGSVSLARCVCELGKLSIFQLHSFVPLPSHNEFLRWLVSSSL